MMRRLQKSTLVIVVVHALLIDMAVNATAQEVITYAISSGSKFTLEIGGGLPIPGGQPSPTMLDFGLSGTLTVSFDNAGGTAQITTSNITLSGNEAVRNMLPMPFGQPLVPLTPTSMQQLLGFGRFQESARSLDHVTYTRPTGAFSYLTIDRFISDGVSLTGGFDARPVDGDGRFFNLTATLIPEPSGCLIGATLSVIGLARSSRRGKSRHTLRA